MSNVQLSLFDGAPEDIDQTIFATRGTELEEVTRMAQKLTDDAKRYEGQGKLGRGWSVEISDTSRYRRIHLCGWSSHML